MKPSKPILTFPCKEHLGTLVQTGDKHYYCSGCAKSLRDYTADSEEDFQTNLKHETDLGNNCGVFRKDQFNMYLPSPVTGFFQKPMRWSVLAILGAVSMLTTACDEQPEAKPHKPDEKENEMDLFRKLKFPIYLRGKVNTNYEEDRHLPLTVQLIEHGNVIYETQTTEDGYYVIELQKNMLKTPDFELVISGMGFKKDTVDNTFFVTEYFRKPLTISMDASVLPDKYFKTYINDYLQKNKRPPAQTVQTFTWVAGSVSGSFTSPTPTNSCSPLKKELNDPEMEEKFNELIQRLKSGKY